MTRDNRHHIERWRQLASEASEETDAEKLTEIVEELCRELDDQMPSRKSALNLSQAQI
jgi:hypothetical protein